jgi:hypothetical protein
MQEEIHRHRSVCLLDCLPPTRLQLDSFAVFLPFSMYACNVNLGVVSVVRLEEWRVFELLAEGCMLLSRKFRRLLCDPLLVFSFCEGFDETCRVILAGICWRHDVWESLSDGYNSGILLLFIIISS